MVSKKIIKTFFKKAAGILRERSIVRFLKMNFYNLFYHKKKIKKA